MICCAHFSILASVSLDTPVYSTWSHSRYSVWRIVWLLSSPLLSAQSGTSASGEKGAWQDHMMSLYWLHHQTHKSAKSTHCQYKRSRMFSHLRDRWSNTQTYKSWLHSQTAACEGNSVRKLQLIHVTPSNPWLYHYPLILLCVIEVLVAKQHQHTNTNKPLTRLFFHQSNLVSVYQCVNWFTLAMYSTSLKS